MTISKTLNKLFFVFTGIALASCGAIDFQYKAPSTFSPDSKSYLSLQTSEIRLKIGSAVYVVSHLESIFGRLPTADRNLILNNIPIMGGTEDFYERRNALNREAPVNPVSVSAREALLIRTCHSIAQNDQRVRVGISRIYSVNGSALSNMLITGPVSDEEYKLAYKAFFPKNEINDSSLESLKTLVFEADQRTPANATQSDSWRFLFLALCLDPTWQVL